MKRIILLLLMALPGVNSIAQKSARPNIIVFLVDDMGWMDTSVPFADSVMPLNQRYHTPNMKRLAAEGVKFTNAYAQPVCTPSRTSMLTGMNAARTRVTNWTSPNKNVDSDAGDALFSPLNWNRNGLSNVPGTAHAVYATTFPQLLKEAGYYTIQVGKAHWGAAGTPGANPYNLGFMVNIAGHAGGHPQSYLSEQHYGNMPGKAQLQAVPDLEEYYDTNTFLTEALTREAIKALETPIRRKEPFYLNMCQYAVHTPIMADPRFVQKYYDAGLDSTEAAYASLLEGMDKSLGDLMNYLQQKGVAGNTVVIFMSDNGGLDHHQRGGAANTHNYPLRSGKGSVYEGGIREPMIVKWPGVVRPGTVNATPVIIEDFFPSILEIAQAGKGRIVQPVDGRSFVPLLKTAQQAVPPRPLVFHYPNKWIHIGPDEEATLGINYYTAMRYGNWKLVYRMRTQAFELYDLSNDIREARDLVGVEKEQVKKLARIFGQILKERSAQMPVEKLTGKAVPFPDEKIQ
ncbi:sulfatase [Niabella sp.]|uniref:sulfatase n=1 Tax=Niabella sp. TaxID=1962976 RepID=UPI00262A455A|nr:sulfatase [Niabella sp.]